MTEQPDIVLRLLTPHGPAMSAIPWSSQKAADFINAERKEAAREIERLRGHLEEANKYVVLHKIRRGEFTTDLNDVWDHPDEDVYTMSDGTDLADTTQQQEAE